MASVPNRLADHRVVMGGIKGLGMVDTRMAEEVPILALALEASGLRRPILSMSCLLTLTANWTPCPDGRLEAGHYSDAVLSSLESQNDTEIEGITAKVKMLKDITVAIGSEIRQSSALADDLNNSFDNTRVRLRGTMNRMLRMAARTGVGWRVWLLFFVVVFFLFAYVWLS
ncbi:hypothetical protein Egran_02894 [Elaphomyces granulatus]|uniref:t-SNARE coiled-coil homology domain-containing protein n=1 Tax=Elaphomyces granulatus TaxID=519963 RepID=A0A232LYU8_9EURO|nr:hypothetical protein Egran_02894 [Elaphomyces granulatus]